MNAVRFQFRTGCICKLYLSLVKETAKSENEKTFYIWCVKSASALKLYFFRSFLANQSVAYWASHSSARFLKQYNVLKSMRVNVWIDKFIHPHFPSTGEFGTPIGFCIGSAYSTRRWINWNVSVYSFIKWPHWMAGPKSKNIIDLMENIIRNHIAPV